jgi:hypothetical protein
MNEMRGAMRTPELVASILKQGGRLLVVGENLENLPKQYQDHPQLIIWDNDYAENRTIPANVKIIVWNRWISHVMRDQLNSAASSLRALKFPNLRTREIKELLSEVVQEDAVEVTEEVIEKEIEVANVVNEVAFGSGTSDVGTEGPMKKDEQVPKKIVAKGELKGFVAKHISLSVDYSVKGTIAAEGKRLYKKAKDEGIKTTESSVIQAVSKMLRDLKHSKGVAGKKVEGVSLATKVQADRKAAAKDDFEQLDNLIVDAIAAMRLVQEHLPKVKKETERLRALKEKMLRILE